MLSPSTEVLISSVLQVVGKKYIRLYPSFLQDELYPYSETMLCNSSQVSFFIPKSNLIFWIKHTTESWLDSSVPKLGGFKLWLKVDLDNIDETEFQKAMELEFMDCILEEGEMLYIPPKWWHYVRSLTMSLSVSFWWSNEAESSSS